MTKKFSSLLLLFLLAVSVTAQTLTGTVTDGKTGEALSFVNVICENGGATQTGLNGRFSLPFKAGKLRVSMIGYETKHLRVKKAGTLNIQLTPL